MTQDTNFTSSYVAICVVNAFLCYTAIMLNSLTIHAIRKTSSLPTPLKCLLLNLAVSDLGVGLIVQPLGVAVFIMEMEPNAESNPTYKIMRTLLFVPLNLFYYATFFGVAALCVDRFLAIHLHLGYQELVTYKRIVAVMTSIWISSAFISFDLFWIPLRTRSIISATIELVGLLTTALLYCKIYLTVRRHSRQIQTLQVQQEAQVDETMNAVRLRKSAIGTFYVYLVFLACYLPQNCLYVVRVIFCSGSFKLDCLAWHLARYTWTLTWLNSSLNPLIYSWKMEQIRQAIKKILRSIHPGHID